MVEGLGPERADELTHLRVVPAWFHVRLRTHAAERSRARTRFLELGGTRGVITLVAVFACC
jgi:NhaP-type Na+/H+ or K+/H+ antiporter